VESSFSDNEGKNTMARQWITLLAWLSAATWALAAPNRDGKSGDAKKPADPVKITVELPKDAPTLDQVNQGKYKVAVQLKNTGKKDLVLYPYLGVEVQDAKGKAVPRSRFIGRWGLLTTNSIVEGIPFVFLKPGKTHKIEIGLPFYLYDENAITGWKLPAKGQYKLVLRYRFDRADIKQKFGRGCKDLDNKTKPWNRALEINKKVEVKLKVGAAAE
jgi:hypothetical protein